MRVGRVVKVRRRDSVLHVCTLAPGRLGGGRGGGVVRVGRGEVGRATNSRPT